VTPSGIKGRRRIAGRPDVQDAAAVLDARGATLRARRSTGTAAHRTAAAVRTRRHRHHPSPANACTHHHHRPSPPCRPARGPERAAAPARPAAPPGGQARRRRRPAARAAAPRCGRRGTDTPSRAASPATVRCWLLRQGQPWSPLQGQPTTGLNPPDQRQSRIPLRQHLLGGSDLGPRTFSPRRTWRQSEPFSCLLLGRAGEACRWPATGSRPPRAPGGRLHGDDQRPTLWARIGCSPPEPAHNPGDGPRQHGSAGTLHMLAWSGSVWGDPPMRTGANVHADQAHEGSLLPCSERRELQAARREVEQSRGTGARERTG
jgi:hypothetical protein